MIQFVAEELQTDIKNIIEDGLSLPWSSKPEDLFALDL